MQWNVHIFGDSTAAGARTMQVWIGINGTEDITYAYDPAPSARTRRPTPG